MVVLLLFFCSGATALVYEVLWSKYLSLMLGSTVQAQTVVLAVFMGGLAIGNRIFGRRSDAIREPLRTYAILELIIGAYAFLFPRLFRIGDYLFVKVGSAVVDTPILPLFLKLFLSVVLLLLPTILMGGTLPLLATWIQRQSGFDVSTRVGIFYATNSLGAVLGAGLAGFFLVQNLGLVSSLEMTALANMFVGFVAVVVAKRESLDLTPARQKVDTTTGAAIASPIGVSLGVLVALTGGVSMGLEVLSSRALAMIAGGSLQSFSLVLMSFILGIGLGSVAISTSKAAKNHTANTVYVLLFSAASLVVIHVINIEGWAFNYAKAKYGLAPNQIGYVWHQFAVGFVAFIFLGLPAACLGAVVPLAIRLGNLTNAALGEQVGRLLTWNTIGAVCGVLVTGFFLMPVLGLRAALATLAVVLICAAGFIAFQRQHSRVVFCAVVLGAVSIAAVASTGERWRIVMSAGMFRVRNVLLTKDALKQRQSLVQLVYYKDSPDATVSVEKGSMTNNMYQLTLRLNGKSDASTIGDVATQYLLAHIPMMAKPDAKNVFVLGFGSGITAGALLGHPIERLTVAENCKPVLEAGELFAQWNRGVLTNSRTRIVNDDARSVLKLHRDKYDVIVSEPSNPWVVGIGSVFSQDFYNLCASRLTEGGMMAQWFHKYEMSDDIIFLIFRTFASVFPNMEIWDTQEGDLILLGSKKPWPSDPSRYQVLFDRPQPAKDLADIRVKTPVALWARQVASQRTASAIPGDGPIQTDEFPLLEYAAPLAFFMGGQANRMYFFDERTVQFPLAEKAKIAAMRALPNPVLVESYSLFGASNPDVRLYVQAAGAAPNAPRIDAMGHIIFRAPESYPENPGAGPQAKPELVDLVRLEAALLRDDEHWLDHARKIEQVLRYMIAKDDVRPKDFKPEYFAALGVRSAIGHEDFQTALEILQLGFVFAPSDEQLSYLSRVLDRVVPPDVLERAKQRAREKDSQLKPPA